MEVNEEVRWYAYGFTQGYLFGVPASPDSEPMIIASHNGTLSLAYHQGLQHGLSLSTKPADSPARTLHS